METVGSYDAKTNLPRLLRKVADGESVTITKHGVPIAVLSPYSSSRTRSPKEAIEAIRRLRKEVKPGPRLNIRKAIEEGRM